MVFGSPSTINDRFLSVPDNNTIHSCARTTQGIQVVPHCQRFPLASEFQARGLCWEVVSPPPVPPFSFHCFTSVAGARFLPSAWGFMAGMPRLVSHGSSLHLEDGCQQWKLLDASGTQRPLREAVGKSEYLLLLFQKSTDVSMFILHSRLIITENAWLPSVFFVDSNGPY